MKKFISGAVFGAFLIAATTAIGAPSQSVPGTIVQEAVEKYPRVEIDKPGVAMAVYSSEDSGLSIPYYKDGVSKIQFWSKGNHSTIYNSATTGLVLSGQPRAVISGREIALAPADNGYVIVPAWSKVKTGNKTLQAELDAKADRDKVKKLESELADVKSDLAEIKSQISALNK